MSECEKERKNDRDGWRERERREREERERKRERERGQRERARARARERESERESAREREGQTERETLVAANYDNFACCMSLYLSISLSVYFLPLCLPVSLSLYTGTIQGKRHSVFTNEELLAGSGFLTLLFLTNTRMQ